MRYLGYIVFAVLLAACSSGDFTAAAAQDSGLGGDSAADSGSDTENQDVSVSDTGSDQNTDSPLDTSETTPESSVIDSSADTTGTKDTGTADSGTKDSDTADTGTQDTGTPDTGTADTGTKDSGTADTGHFDATTCPAPASTATFDASGLSCNELIAEYLKAVLAAKTCGCSKDCSATVCDSICCSCSVGVNPGHEAYPKARAIYAEWQLRVAAATCKAPFCPNYACATPTTFVCTANATCVAQ